METEQFTILKALEKVHQTSQDSKLMMERYDVVKSEIQFISSYFQISEIQSIFLASFFCLACFDEIELRELIKYLGVEKINLLPYMSDLQYLVDKNILNKSNNNRYSREDYSLKKSLLDFIASNNEIPIDLISVIAEENSFHSFLGDLDVLSEAKDNKDLDYPHFLYQFRKLLESNRKFKLVNYACEHLDLSDTFVFFDTIIDAIAKGENDFNTILQSTVDDFTNRKRDSFEYISNFLLGKTKLNTLDLIEKDNNQFGNRHRIQLSQKALTMLKEMEGLSFIQKESKNDKLIYPDKIKKSNLFYNPQEKQLLEPVSGSMSRGAFSNLQKRLKANNMPLGVSALLYGAPGTGKTETVYQMAKKYNRPIYKVEISETKSMWFGESQKLVKKIFTDYYEFKKQEKICPILLFNEADAVLGKRKAAGSSSVSDTENAIQNILLEELENFDGILFATSNLVNNLDAAFERRFLFKIKFDAPSTENAAKIWKSKLPQISTKQAQFLANNFKFSGGEMENIARKCLMEEVILGNKGSFEKIITFCENERWDKNNSMTKIGF